MGPSYYAELFLSLFVICSPFVAVPVMLSLTRGYSDREKKRMALTATFAIGAILIGFCWIGNPLLFCFGIRLASLQVGGGILVFLLGLSALRSDRSVHNGSPGGDSDACVAVVPLATPLMAGPGAIGRVIIATEEFPGIANQFRVTFVILVVTIALGLCLYFSGRLEKFLGKTGLNVMSSLGGLLLLAIAVETIVKGIIGCFPGIVT